MKMDGGSLAGLSLALNSGACLKLIGVNMTGTQISLRSGALLPICKDSVTKSEIKNNPGLCGDDLVKLMGFFGKTAAAVAVEPHESCGTLHCSLAGELLHSKKIRRYVPITSQGPLEGGLLGSTLHSPIPCIRKVSAVGSSLFKTVTNL